MEFLWNRFWTGFADGKAGSKKIIFGFAGTDAKTATSGDAQSDASGKEVRTGNSGKSNVNQDLVEV